jgi:hypothetical protein
MSMKRSSSRVFMIVVFMTLVASAGFAQQLAVSTAKPVVDGVVAEGEYTYVKAFGPVVLSASRTADTLFVAVTGDTSGWVALGLGSLKMNGATIFMGFVDDKGAVQFKPQAAAGHRHSDAEKAVAGSVVSYAMKTAGGKTTLELALKAAPYVTGGQSTLDAIFAIGQAKSFLPLHSFRGSTSITLS